MLAVIAPWALGGSLSIAVIGRISQVPPLLLFGAGSLLVPLFLGFLSVSKLEWIASHPRTIALLAVVAISFLGKNIWDRRPESKSGWVLLLIFPTTLMLIASAWLAATIPASGWDALDYWLPRAVGEARGIGELTMVDPKLRHPPHCFKHCFFWVVAERCGWSVQNGATDPLVFCFFVATHDSCRWIGMVGGGGST